MLLQHMKKTNILRWLFKPTNPVSWAAFFDLIGIVNGTTFDEITTQAASCTTPRERRGGFFDLEYELGVFDNNLKHVSLWVKRIFSSHFLVAGYCLSSTCTRLLGLF